MRKGIDYGLMSSYCETSSVWSDDTVCHSSDFKPEIMISPEQLLIM